MKKTYKIEVDCANCANKMEEAARKTEGVRDAVVNFMTLKMSVEFEEGYDHKEVMKQVLANCQAMCRVLKEEGFRLVSGGSDNHLVLVDVKSSTGMTGKQAEALLDSVNITCNKNSIPFDEEKPAYCSGIRLGTAAMTTRGCRQDDFEKIALWISRVLKNPEDQEVLNKVREEVSQLTQRLPLY